MQTSSVTPFPVTAQHAAQPASSPFSLVQTDLSGGFDKVISDAMQRGASDDFVSRLFKNQERFIQLAEMASQQQPINSKTFLKNLSYEDREVLREVHSLADFIDDSKIDQMSSEGANNLLRLPHTGLDSDNDGFTDIGIGKTFMFPNSNTPPEVAEAWHNTTDGMSFKDKMMAEGHLMSSLIMANIEVDENGRFVARHEPGEPGYVNPLASADFSYKQWSTDWLRYLEDFKLQMSSDQYNRDKRFFEGFLQNLQQTGAV
ncbi:hypothetical protein SAMN03080615_02185 [Amphritea atlantica]|uniref:Uncharacterized protein n=1 Tax=Amphritea atlantica TaxID=355243 RepID=A0A1H9HJG8_9GAMM|nr:hypothetical protein [Amphritea atlantica]SEQ62499.1 hypothetical protein SAMN03080615_02185 [Amphritea atlantica]